MIKVRLQIADGNIVDTADAYGLIYLSADSRFGAPIKEMEKTTYAEQEGENIYPKTVSDAFDYKTTWFIKANGSLETTNAVIAEFNSLLYTQEGDVKNFKQVTFYNDYKRIKIVGTPKPIADAKEFWRDSLGVQHDIVVVEWLIRVSKPSLCDFNI